MSDAQLATKRPHVEPTPTQQDKVVFRVAEDVAYVARPSSSFALSFSS